MFCLLFSIQFPLLCSLGIIKSVPLHAKLLVIHSGAHKLVLSYTTNNTLCPKMPTVPWELYLWSAVHCGTGAVERDSGIKQELSFSMDPIHLAGTHQPFRVTSPDLTQTKSGWKHLVVPLSGVQHWVQIEGTVIQSSLIHCKTCTHWQIEFAESS